MDSQKDTRIASLASFFERTPARLSIPLNQPADRLFRRAERLAAGIFLATNHISPEDPLRAQVRDISLEILQQALRIRDELRNPQSSQVVHFKATARYAISLIRMLAIAGSLSLQNAGVLVEALDELGTYISSAQHSPLSDTVSLTKDDLMDTRVSRSDDRDHIKDTISIKDNPTMSDKHTSQHIDVRQQNVLDVLAAGGELGIAEISAHLPEYSTKMVQRDLVYLIATGKVARTGHKRWSRYSLPKAVS